MPKQVLTEDQYVGKLKNIIETSYFPDIERRNLQLAFLNAYSQYLDGRIHANVFFESATALANYYNSLLCPGKKSASPSLSNFLAKNTSEDNSSFETLLESINEKKRSRFHEIYKSTMAPVMLIQEGTQERLQQPINSEPDQTSFSLQIIKKGPATSKLSAFKKPSGKNSLFFSPVSVGNMRSLKNLRFSPSFNLKATRFAKEHQSSSSIDIESLDLESLSDMLFLRIKAEFSVTNEPVAYAPIQTNTFNPEDFIPVTPSPDEMTPQKPPSTPNRFQILPTKEREIIGRRLAHELKINSPAVTSTPSITPSKRAPGTTSRSQHSARAILSTSPAIRRMIGASIRRQKLDAQSTTPNFQLESAQTPSIYSQKQEWEAPTPDITK